MEYKIDENRPERLQYLKSIDDLIAKEYDTAADRRKKMFSSKDKELLRRKYVSMLGYPLTEYDSYHNGKVICKSNVIFKSADLSIQRLQFKMPNGLLFSGMLFVPAAQAENNALLVVLHGAQGAPEILCATGTLSDNYNNFVRRILKKGLVVFAPQLLLWNKERFRQDYDREIIDKKLRQLGGSIAALEIYCLRKAIDYLSESKEIRAERVGCAGLSYGGMYALALATVDSRVKATLCSGFFNERTEYLYDWFYRNQAKIAFDAEQALLIAERKLYIELGAEDKTFSVEFAKREIARLTDYIESMHIDKSFLQVNIHGGGHEFDVSDDGIRFLQKELIF